MIRSPSISSGLAAALVLAALAVPISAAAQSRVTFGGDTWVRPGETVDDLVVFGADARVDGRVRGDAIVFGGRLEVGPDAVIDGDQVVLGGEVVTSHGARVSGDRVGIGASYSDGPAAAAEEAREAGQLAAEEAREAGQLAAEEAREAGQLAAE
ncbi:polymer-forming cytoskeletal protein, partial [Myxococcota bacterium]|nr:polymer-forming cytoskeletal protein [Myxococcota bacterium]